MLVGKEKEATAVVVRVVEVGACVLVIFAHDEAMNVNIASVTLGTSKVRSGEADRQGTDPLLQFSFNSNRAITMK